jgi:hypothetical protein
MYAESNRVLITVGPVRLGYSTVLCMYACVMSAFDHDEAAFSSFLTFKCAVSEMEEAVQQSGAHKKAFIQQYKICVC